MKLIAGVDVGGSAVKAWVAESGGHVLTTEIEALDIRHPAPHRAEFDPTDWWAACRSALGRAVGQAPAGDWLGITVCSLRQGFVLTDGRVELGYGVLNSDRRGAPYLDEVRAQRSLYAVTRHWAAPELTLPKLLAIRTETPRVWAAARRLLFVHDWLLWRLCGAEVTEISYACAGQLAHVSRRQWARTLLDDLGIGTDLLAPLVEPGVVVGAVRDSSLGLPVGLPVVSGCGDTQLAAAGAGAAHRGAVCIVAGSSTPVIAALDSAPLDEQRRPWVSTHVRVDTWAVETNCGYPGTMLHWLAGLLGVGVEDLFGMASAAGSHTLTAVVGTPHWTERNWSAKPPRSLLGLHPGVSAADLAAAFTEGYAYAVRANLTDLEEVLGGQARDVVLTGGGATPGLAGLLARVTGRAIAVPRVRSAAALAGSALVAAAVGESADAALPEIDMHPAGDPAAYDKGFQRYLAAYDALLPET